ncbi:bifunctional adenosylcobinamide kinase/adenosylcobinamide-phosphate guanylyltransferase [Desulfovibrionales bacterium]
MISLVLGGNKSGKSAFGERLLAQSPVPHAVVVTGKAKDMGFRQQIQDHRLARPVSMAVHEAGPDLLGTLQSLPDARASVLVDSLDFWLFSIWEHCSDRVARNAACQELCDGFAAWQGKALVLVSTEMGLGPLPVSDQARAFARALGELNQKIASISKNVYAVIAGLPLQLKGEGYGVL